MESYLVFEERTGLLSGTGRIVFAFRHTYFQHSSDKVPASDFKGWDQAQGFFELGDDERLMVRLDADPNDRFKASITSQQVDRDFEKRLLHCPEGLAVGSQIYVSYESMPKVPPSPFEVIRLDAV